MTRVTPKSHRSLALQTLSLSRPPENPTAVENPRQIKMAIKEEEFKIDGVATDYSLIVQTEADPPETFVFKVHKTVLASASKVFAEMFMSGPKDSDPEKSGTVRNAPSVVPSGRGTDMPACVSIPLTDSPD